jgi:hypothetical protein
MLQVLRTVADDSHNHIINNVDGLQDALDAKQATLVSGTNIKTINSNSILGSGNIAIEGYTDADALSLFHATGSAPVYACRAWVNFNGTGTVSIRASGNVSSVGDLGTGYYRVNFTTAMQDTNYAAITWSRSNDETDYARTMTARASTAKATTYMYFRNCAGVNASMQDTPEGNVAILR